MRIMLYAIISTLLLVSCSNDKSNDFSLWTEETVYSFLNEINNYISEIPTETDNKEIIEKLYEKYFSKELSVRIVDSLYSKVDRGWKLLDGDAGYIFIVPNNKQNEVSIKFNKDTIIVEEVYENETWMYSKIEYTITHDGKPVITVWNME